MKDLYFVFCVHNHQPVGNFDWVIEDAYRRSYFPFLEVLGEHPSVKFAMHVSGCLWEWIEDAHPEYLERIAELVARGQLEILTGGFYEPILAMIPDEDKLSQITRYSEHLKARLGVDPKGMWMAERVWEPQMARWLADAGVRYTALDDFHFLASGISQEALVSHYTTEDQGRFVQVFPMSEALRYLIPFRSVKETERHMKIAADMHPGRLMVFGDDGEKFGIWPGTHRTVYERGWLKSFLAMLERNADWLHTITFSEWLDRSEPAGCAYLPTLSYPEMMEWSLPADRWGEYRENRKAIVDRLGYAGSPPFLRGGFWRGFLAKYPESRRMYARMLDVRSRLAEAAGPGSDTDLEPAWRDLWRGQCNCAYWHGVFGGLYPKHLRAAIFSRLISAEVRLENRLHESGGWVDRRTADVDGDGHPEIQLSTPDMNLFVSPRRGGTIFELDIKPARANLLATLARRPEGYHADLVRAAEEKHGENPDPTGGIHGRVVAKEAGLDAYLVYDERVRDSWTCQFLSASETVANLKNNAYHELGDFLNAPFVVRGSDDASPGTIVLWREGHAHTPAGVRRLGVSKTLEVVGPDELVLGFDLVAGSEAVEGICLGSAFNLALSDGSNPECYYILNGNDGDRDLLGIEADTDDVRSVTVVDRYLPARVDLTFDRPTRLVRFPVITVSQSESGFAKSYQSPVLIGLWAIQLAAGESARIRIGARVSVPETAVETTSDSP